MTGLVRDPGCFEAAPVLRAETPNTWRMAIEFALDDGWRFDGLHASAGHDEPAVNCVLSSGPAYMWLTCPSQDKTVPSVIDLAPAAVWDEREAHDKYDWTFTGHEPMRPLVNHPEDPADWITTVSGDDVNQVTVGPIHAGIIESGHFRFHVVGERVLHLDLRMFHKHRGLESAAAGKTFDSALAYAQRACGADAVANSIAYANACECLLGLAPDGNLRKARTTLLELERIYNHLSDISAIYAGIGFSPGTMLFAGLKERAMRLNKALTGHRFLFNSVLPGAGGFHLSKSEARSARDDLKSIFDDFSRSWRAAQFVGTAQERFEGVGVLSLSHAKSLGAVGPAARASGVSADSRASSPRLHYPDFKAARPFDVRGDVGARFEMRGAELEQSFKIVDRLLADAVTPGSMVRTGDRSPSGIGVGFAESPRGRTVCCVEGSAADQTIARMRLRTGSYANWPSLTRCTRNEMIADFPLINKSFELCYACVDR